MLDKEFEAYQTYDWGVDPKALKPVDDAIVASHGDAAARKDLETRIAAVLTSKAPRAAKDYACRQLRTIGTAASVPVLTALLMDEELSHMARYALERIPDPEAGTAMRNALPRAAGTLKIGLISSLGVRGEADSVATMKSLLGDRDGAVACAAAHALGAIGSPEASKTLASAKTNAAAKEAVADALLICAENVLATGQKGDAKAIYQWVWKNSASEPAKHAAELGAKACDG
jgi:HEAT repeat protein